MRRLTLLGITLALFASACASGEVGRSDAETAGNETVGSTVATSIGDDSASEGPNSEDETRPAEGPAPETTDYPDEDAEPAAEVKAK